MTIAVGFRGTEACELIVESEGPGKIIRVGAADKSPLVQAALKHLFAEDHRFDLLEVVADGDQFLGLVEKSKIDVGVIGWVIAPGDGKFILDQLRGHAAAPRIVVYTGAQTSIVPAQAMAHGAAAFVSKSEQPSYLLDTIKNVAQGRMVFPFLDVRSIHDNLLTSLTRKELEVLSLVATGQSNKQIAATQNVSPNTVKFHMKNVFEKLGVRTRSQAVALYFKS